MNGAALIDWLALARSHSVGPHANSANSASSAPGGTVPSEPNGTIDTIGTDKVEPNALAAELLRRARRAEWVVANMEDDPAERAAIQGVP